MRRFLYQIATDQIGGGFVPIAKVVLWLLSKVYGVLLIIRKVFYTVGVCKSHRLTKPVISVGNLTVGGVGKTPLVAFIAKALKNSGSHPVILMRGYMAKKAPTQMQNSDEAAMLKKDLDIPVLTGANRVKSAQMFLKENAIDVFLLDDGFQHWKLSRDIDIVAIDATDPWGNGYLLPRGILREPKKALSRAHIFVVTKSDLGKDRLEEIRNDLKEVNPKALIVEAIHKPVLFSDLRSRANLDLTSVRGEKICTVCSIGNPNSFIKTMVELEVDIDEHFAFIDHYTYRAKDVERIIRACQKRGIKTIVITEKDAVKFGPFVNVFPDNIRVLSLKIEIVIVSGEDVFLERIDHLL